MRALLLALLALLAAAAPASAGVTDPLAAARGHYLDLRSRGHLRAAAAFSTNADPQYSGSPGYAIYDFKKKECAVFLNPEAIKTFEFDEPFAFRFMVYHELAHCELYAFPHELKPLPGAGERGNRMLSDLVHLEFLHNDDARPVNGYSTYHETYADVKAVALLLAEGQPRAKVLEIVRYRESNSVSFMDSHDNAGVFARILEKPWAGWDPARVDAEARAAADLYVPVNFLKKVLGAGTAPFVASQLVAATLRMPLSVVRFEYSSPEDRALIEGRLRDVADSPQDAWREYARLERTGASAERLIEAFFLARYGAKPDELAEDDAAVARALEAALR